MEGSIPEPRNAKHCRQPPDAGRETRKAISLSASRRNQLCRHLGFGLLISGTVREQVSVALRHEVVVICYGSHGHKFRPQTHPMHSLPCSSPSDWLAGWHGDKPSVICQNQPGFLPPCSEGVGAPLGPKPH